ncbi:MAG TPA: hypothetical protein VM840_12945 [Actinomycetota bacterium]|nr:hypothetical protein [Actinomycetota bacterium]
MQLDSFLVFALLAALIVAAIANAALRRGRRPDVDHGAEERVEEGPDEAGRRAGP